MLSVTVMPAELHCLSGMPGLLVFKVVYPVIGALFPVAVFGLARLVLPSAWAFVAARDHRHAEHFRPGSPRPGPARGRPGAVRRAADGHAGQPDAAAPAVGAGRPARAWQWWCRITPPPTWPCCSSACRSRCSAPCPGSAPIPRVTGAVAVAFVAALAGAAMWYGPVTHSGAPAWAASSSGRRRRASTSCPTRAPGGGLLAAYLEGENPTSMSAGDIPDAESSSTTSNHLRHAATAANEPQYALA